MRKLILAAVLVGAAANAAADWKVIDEQEARVTYVDPSEIRVTGNMARIWTMVDFKNMQTMPSGTRYRSSKTLSEFDCKEGKIRMLQATAFSGKKGTGIAVFSGAAPEEWSYVTPGSVDALKQATACK